MRRQRAGGPAERVRSNGLPVVYTCLAIDRSLSLIVYTCLAIDRPLSLIVYTCLAIDRSLSLSLIAGYQSGVSLIDNIEAKFGEKEHFDIIVTSSRGSTRRGGATPQGLSEQTAAFEGSHFH